MLQQFIGQVVVIDLRSEYVCIGKLVAVDEQFLELHHVDVHDLRDTQTTRENYAAEARLSGVKRNRKRAVLMRSEVVAVALLDDVVDT
jgi:small nuclear ribonucleoprotein (snRNP)-like protein